MNKKLGMVIVLIVVITAVLLWAFGPKTGNPLSVNVAQKSTSQYLCDEGKSIDAHIEVGESKTQAVPGQPPEQTGAAHVKLSDGREMDLKQTNTADGVRFANTDESLVFWTKGNGALVLENNQDQTYIGCVLIAEKPENSNLDAPYANAEEGFSLRLPSYTSSTSPEASKYTLDEAHRYTALGQAKSIKGIKFTIPKRMTEGTNLSSDSYISVETLPGAINSCAAERYLSDAQYAGTKEGRDNRLFSVATSTGAAAGNRYEETVYATPYGNGCIAVRYFIHYGVLENYPQGSTKAFEREQLIHEFDQIRDTLIVI